MGLCHQVYRWCIRSLAASAKTTGQRVKSTSQWMLLFPGHIGVTNGTLSSRRSGDPQFPTAHLSRDRHTQSPPCEGAPAHHAPADLSARALGGRTNDAERVGARNFAVTGDGYRNSRSPLGASACVASSQPARQALRRRARYRPRSRGARCRALSAAGRLCADIRNARCRAARADRRGARRGSQQDGDAARSRRDGAPRRRQPTVSRVARAPSGLLFWATRPFWPAARALRPS